MFMPSLMREIDNETYKSLSTQEKIFAKQDMFDSRGKTGEASGYAKVFGITEEQAENILSEWSLQRLALECGCEDTHIVKQIII